MLDGFSKKSKKNLAITSIVLLITIGVAAQWALSKNYQPLFIGLEPKDSAAIVQQLDTIGAAYRINSQTGNVEVPEAKLHQTRLQLMSSDVSINGSVGYEIFDNSDFGMTEFAQQINFQRALEGELQRTITSLTQVKSSRVHLVLPERSLFRENKEQPSASVTLVIKKTSPLTTIQIAGIQRLVASSVAGLNEHMVTISDQEGVTLNQAIPTNNSEQAIPWRLKQKKDMETYLTEKVSRVLSYAFNEGEVVVSIDVIMNFDQTKKMEEKVIPLEGGRVISKEKESTIGGNKKSKSNSGNTSKEVEYEVGRSISEITENPGKIQKISVGILLTKFLSEDDKKQLRQLVETTVGFNNERGDSVAIYTNLEKPLIKKESFADFITPSPIDKKISSPKGETTSSILERIEKNWGYTVTQPMVIALFLLLIFIIFALVITLLFRRSSQPKKLSKDEREALLMKLQHWLSDGK